jgi:hypothetical protein
VGWRRRTLTALWLAVAVASGAMVGGTFGAFSASTKNTTNTFQAAPCFSPTQTIVADADAWVQEDSANTNKGGDALLNVQPNNNKRRRALVHFSLPAIPAGCSGVASATLRLNASASAAGHTIDVRRAGAAWVENTVTWNNQPGSAGTAVSAASGGGWITWNVATHVRGLYQGSNFGFVISDAADGSGGSGLQQFSSKEAASNRPELVIMFGGSSSAAPVAMDLQVTNGGTTVGRPEPGDAITLTFSEPMGPGSILAGWSGASSSVVVRLNTSGSDDTVNIYNAGNTAQLNLGTMQTQGNYVTANATFGASGTPSTMVMSGVTITITLGTLAGTVRTDNNINTWTWSPSTAATDLAGDPCEASTATESGTQDQDF